MDVRVDTMSSAIEQILKLVNARKGGVVCLANVHMCMEVFDSQLISNAVNSADLVLADGRPIYWGQKLLGNKGLEQIRGTDLMLALCKLSHDSKLSIGLYGGEDQSVLNAVKHNLKKQFPYIKIEFTQVPPLVNFNEPVEESLIQSVNQSNIDVLFVGLGCPKQEVWMHKYKTHLNCVMLGVGAAYDFIAGNKKDAPVFLQRIGAEWLFRLVSEPKRLWKRYAKQNPRFIYYFSKQYIKSKLNRA